MRLLFNGDISLISGQITGCNQDHMQAQTQLTENWKPTRLQFFFFNCLWFITLYYCVNNFRLKLLTEKRINVFHCPLQRQATVSEVYVSNNE